jgi:hypothetical protein
MKPTEFFQQRFEEERRQVEAIDDSLEAMRSLTDVKTSIEQIDPDMDYGDEKKNEIAKSIKDDYQTLLDSIRAYVESADIQEHFAKKNRSEITAEAKDKLIELDADRRATHNMLITDINILDYNLKQLGIDNKLIYAIIKEDRRLNQAESDRRAVERWARDVGKYLATLSETTL